MATHRGVTRNLKRGSQKIFFVWKNLTIFLFIFFQKENMTEYIPMAYISEREAARSIYFRDETPLPVVNGRKWNDAVDYFSEQLEGIRHMKQFCKVSKQSLRETTGNRFKFVLRNTIEVRGGFNLYMKASYTHDVDARNVAKFILSAFGSVTIIQLMEGLEISSMSM